MRFHRLPETLLTSPARVAVLRAILRATGREWTGREVARAAGVSPPQTLEALRRFADEGLVHEKRIGKASVWRVDEGHYLAGLLGPLAYLDEAAQGALVKELEDGLRGSGALEAFLFGSVGTGGEDPNSDVDLLVVFPDEPSAKAWQPRLRDLEQVVLRRFGNPLQALVFTSQRIKRGAPARLHQAALATGAVVEVEK